MASNSSSVARCSRCNFILNEYVELRCKHKLCRFCTLKDKKRDNTIVCFSRKCKRVSQKVPKFSSVVNDMKKSAMSEFKVSMKKKEDECIKHVEKLEKSVKELWDDEQRQMDFISSMYEKRVNELSNHYGRLKTKTAGSFKKRKDKIEKILSDIKNILIKVHDELKKMNDSAELPCESEQAHILISQSIQVDIPSIETVIHADGQLGITDDIEIIAPEPELRISTTMEQNLDLDQISSVQWVRQEQSVKLPDIPTRLRLMPNNELWQCHYGGITVLDAELRPLREIKSKSESGDMGYVQDVAALRDGDFAVAGTQGLFQIDHEGTNRRRIAEGFFTGVAEHDGALYAAECGTGRIRVYEQANGWVVCRRIDLGCGPQIITISVHDNMIYACLYKKAKLLAYSLLGESMGSWGSKGNGEAGQLDNPFLCMTGTGGAVLIADLCNSRLQVLGSDRQWSVVSLQPPVKKPIGALLHRDRLLVASCEDDKLYVYGPSGHSA